MNKKDMCEMYDEMIAKENGYKQGAKDENKKRIEQLNYVKNKICDLVKFVPDTERLKKQFLNLVNEIEFMANDN